AAAFDADGMKAVGGPGHAAERILAEVGWPVPDHLAELPWRGTPALTRQTPRPAAERVMVLGDAAGYVEPFTGEGMAWALASARALTPLAVEAVGGWQPDLARRWQSLHRRLFGPRRRLCSAVTRLLRWPRLVRLVVGVLAWTPF